MSRLSDEELLRELSERIEEKNRALFDLQKASRQLTKLNRRLVESEALKTHFLSNIRNEINNPLAAILGLAGEIGGGDARAPEECRSLAAAIQAEAFALAFQLRNVLRAAELEAGESIPLAARVDLRALVETTVESYRPLAALQKQELRTVWDLPPGRDAWFTSDPAMLQEVLANLLSNAVKFGGAGRPVTVCVARAAGPLRLCVEDGGIGIDPADHGAIFERFRQLDRGASKGFGGHGLGLSIVRALLEVLGGSIAVESALGRGSRFTALVPEAEGGAGADVVADAGNEYFFDA